MAAGAQTSRAQIEKSNVQIPGGMGAPLQNAFNQAKGRWDGLESRQRTWSIVGVALLVALLGGLGWYAFHTEWKTLYTGLDQEDARQMSQAMVQAKIPFEVTDNGAGFRVSADDLDRARLATAVVGAHSGRLGFELFDKPNWVGSEFDEQVNYQRALEGELEHTVSSIADVESARVHLVMPHDSLFRDQDRPAKASVVIKLRHRSLADGEDDAIRNLVASAVDGLSPDRVVLIDAAGHLPLGPKSVEASRLSAEQALEAKLIETLEPVTGAGNVRASVTMDYDSTATEETQESYDPTKTVTLSMQRTDQTSGSQPSPAGVPGTASNAPNANPLPVYPQNAPQTQNAKTESGTYASSKTTIHSASGPGRIHRVTVAVLVNDKLVSTGKDQANWQQRSPADLAHLTALAQAAAGYDSSRGDVVTVENMAFEDNHSIVPETMTQKISSWAHMPGLLKYGTILTAVLLIVLFGIRPIFAKQQVIDAGDTKELAAGTMPNAIEENGPEELTRSRALQILEQVSDQLRREPAQSSRLLQSWLNGE